MHLIAARIRLTDARAEPRIPTLILHGQSTSSTQLGEAVSEAWIVNRLREPASNACSDGRHEIKQSSQDGAITPAT